MKRILLIFILALSCTMMLAKGSGGITVSYNSSKLSSGSFSTSNAAGFDIGLIYNQPLFLGLAVQPGIGYSLMRAGAVDGKVSMSYIQVPVQVQWGPDLIFFRPYVLAEPFVAWALGGKSEKNTRDINISASDLLSNLDYGLGVGLGIDIRSTVQLSVKYCWNFGNCGFENYIDSVISSVKEKAKFNGVKISLGILF